MNYFLKKKKSISVGIFVVSMIATGLVSMPRPAHAIFDIVFDPTAVGKAIIGNSLKITSNTLSATKVVLATKGSFKSFVLDGLAWAVAKSALRDITSDMVKAVVSGHVNPNGSTGPGFVTNLKSFALKVGDRAAKKGITDIRKNVSAKATTYAKSMAKSVATDVQKHYYKKTAQTGFWSTHKETLSTVVKDPKDFFKGDFAAGGWDGWNAIDSNVNNNPYYIYQNAKKATAKKVAKAKANKKTELSWGQGFLPKTHCTKNKKGKKTCTTQTPGSIIKTQLNHALGSSVSSLVSAHEINEMISGLAMGLVSKIVGGSGGLRGLTGSGIGGGLSELSKYLHQKSPTINSVASSTKDRIIKKEKSVNTYLSNLHTVLSATKNAMASLQQLISYTPPTTTSPTCTATLNNDVNAAGNAFSKVQNMSSATNVAIAKTNQGLPNLKSLETQTQPTNAADLQKVTTQFLQLESTGKLPNAQDISNAQTAVSRSSGTLASSGVAGLVVSGGTVPEQMNLLANNASNALNGLKTCFSVASTGI